MQLFKKETPFQKEWNKLITQEQKFLQSREDKKDSFLNRKLEALVPSKLQGTLNTAFARAFGLIFEKGTGIIEKTYRKEELEQDFQIRQYAADLKQDRKSLRAVSKKAQNAGAKNLVVSGAAGIGMGLLGIGLPDIPVFTSMVLKNIYEIAIHYGFGYETVEERYFILQIIRGAVSYGPEVIEINRELNRFMDEETLPDGYVEKRQIQLAAGGLSQELLYMKFLQGVPVVGAVGGAYDAVYMKRIAEYANLKYRRRFLEAQRKRKILAT